MSRPTPHLAVSLAALAVTLAVGVLLRGALAGWGWPTQLGSWSHLRSGHSHLGYYGVLFPVVWHTWARLGLRTPGPIALGIYALAAGFSFVGFAQTGYGRVSTTGSTVVLIGWVISALPQLRFLARRDWLAPVAPSVLLAAVAIPGVAVLAAQGDPRSGELVRSFLTWLLFGVVIATCLRGAEAWAPPPWLLLPAVVGSGLALGPLPHPVTWALLALYGALVCVAAARWPGPVDAGSLTLRALWGILGLGVVAVGLGRWGHLHAVAIAGVHFAVLGPVLATGAWPASLGRALPVYGATAGAFALAIVGPLVWPWIGWGSASAGLGAVLAAMWIARIGWACWRRE